MPSSGPRTVGWNFCIPGNRDNEERFPDANTVSCLFVGFSTYHMLSRNVCAHVTICVGSMYFGPESASVIFIYIYI